MAKPFLIGIEVEQPALGSVLHKINGLPGIIKLHMDLKTSKFGHGGDRRSSGYNGGKPRKQFEGNGDEVVLKMFGGRKDKKVTAAQMREEFEKLGRSPSSVHNVSWRMAEGGVMKNHGKGVYTLLDPSKLEASRKLKYQADRRRKGGA